MPFFEWTLVLLVAAVALAALARRWRAPYPSLLALLGCALAFVPGVPSFSLQPDLALALFVAPVLLDAAYDTSVRDVRANAWPIAGLVVVAVGATTAAVAWVAHALVPGLPWAAAIALGAIVAPPDAAAATSVLRSAPIPHRLLKILEGESLLNDASALLIYRFAVAAAMGASVGVAETVPTLAVVLAGSLAAGAGAAWVSLRVLRRVDDAPTAIVLQFTGTFGVWIAAEHVGLSGILTVVVYAIGLARVAPMATPARIRIPSYAVWATVVFVLNVLAFVLIGTQLRPIWERLSPAARVESGTVALAVLATVVATRFAWVLAADAAVRWRARRASARGAASGRTTALPSVRDGIVLGWCGMRGIVTLAAALALPDGERPFPGRDLILLTAFVVVLGTLVLQGLTLRPLLTRLALSDDAPVERETALAREAALRGALERLAGETSPAAEVLREEYRQTLSARRDGAEAADAGVLPALRRDAVAAARRAIDRLRRDGTIGDDAYHRVELQHDQAEVYAEGSGG